METQEYIASGILELYVYGLLTEVENEAVHTMAEIHPEIQAEIISIELAIIDLSTSFSPLLSAANFDSIKTKLELKHAKVIDINPARAWTQYMGWAAAIVLLIGVGFEYTQLNQTQTQMVNVQIEKDTLEKQFQLLDLKNKANESSLSLIRDPKNTVIPLGGQEVAPESFSKVYWNKESNVVYVDAAGLPEPPEGMVYQVWALKLNPLTPTSIGLLADFSQNNQRIFAVNKTADAEAFGITLEPAGGSASPTMAQLYTLGKV